MRPMAKYRKRLFLSSWRIELRMEEKSFINAVPWKCIWGEASTSESRYIYRISNYLRILWRCSATLIPLTWRERERDSQRSVMNCKSTRRRRTVSGSSAPLRLLALWIIYVKNKFTSCSSSISIPPRFYYHFSDELSPDYFPGSV